MKEFQIYPKIVQYDTCTEFAKKVKLNSQDLIFTGRSAYERFLKPHLSGKVPEKNIIFLRDFGTGEPSDEMVEAVYAQVKDISYERVIAIGGGSILDVAKLFGLETISPVLDLFDGKCKPVKTKKVLLLPTTCGTGSEVTNISILEIKERKTKLGLAVPELFADEAVLIPELLKGLPEHFWATSSVDALIHAFESYTSPKASAFTRMYSRKAMEQILQGYLYVVEHGMDSREQFYEEFLMASTYAGIAFGNAGCGAVHAMSYPLGANYHVPHGEANSVFFTAVYETYLALAPEGEIVGLNNYVAQILACEPEQVYQKLDALLGRILHRKKLHEYGMREDEILKFTETVMTKQGRLMQNNYTELSSQKVEEIYKRLF